MIEKTQLIQKQQQKLDQQQGQFQAIEQIRKLMFSDLSEQQIKKIGNDQIIQQTKIWKGIIQSVGQYQNIFESYKMRLSEQQTQIQNIQKKSNEVVQLLKQNQMIDNESTIVPVIRELIQQNRDVYYFCEKLRGVLNLKKTVHLSYQFIFAQAIARLQRNFY